MNDNMKIEITLCDGRKCEIWDVAEIIDAGDGTILLKREFRGLRQNVVLHKGQLTSMRVKLL